MPLVSNECKPFEFPPEVKVPLAILGAEHDKMSPPELLKQFDEVLNAKSEVRIFPPWIGFSCFHLA